MRLDLKKLLQLHNTEIFLAIERQKFMISQKKCPDEKAVGFLAGLEFSKSLIELAAMKLDEDSQLDGGPDDAFGHVCHESKP